jgi:hypothetical protein
MLSGEAFKLGQIACHDGGHSFVVVNHRHRSPCRLPKLSGRGNRSNLTPWQTITGSRGPL